MLPQTFAPCCLSVLTRYRDKKRRRRTKPPTGGAYTAGVQQYAGDVLRRQGLHPFPVIPKERLAPPADNPRKSGQIRRKAKNLRTPGNILHSAVRPAADSSAPGSNFSYYNPESREIQAKRNFRMTVIFRSITDSSEREPAAGS